MLKLYSRCVALLCFFAGATAAHAEGFALYEYGARGLALGGAVMARTPDPSTVATNPALMTKLPGIQVMAGASAITPSGKMEGRDANGNFSSSLKPATWVIPHMYYTQKLNDSFSVGVGEFSRFGLGFEYPHNWPGRFNIYEVSLQTASINPAVAWAATDKLSLAAGVELVYVNLDLKKRSQPIPGRPFEVDVNIQDANDYGFGFNLAAHYQFNDQWAAGVQYRSQVEEKAYGDAQLSWVGAPIPGVSLTQGQAHATVILPDSWSGGVSWSPLPELSLEAGAIWTRWSSFRDLNIHMPNGTTAFSRKHWKDVWRLNVGAEYDALDWLTLRAGYVFDQSPMTEGHEDYLVPTDDRHIYSVGFGVHDGPWSVDFAFAHIAPVGRSYAANGATNVLHSKANDSKTEIYSVSFGYKF